MTDVPILAPMMMKIAGLTVNTEIPTALLFVNIWNRWGVVVCSVNSLKLQAYHLYCIEVKLKTLLTFRSNHRDHNGRGRRGTLKQNGRQHTHHHVRYRIIQDFVVVESFSGSLSCNESNSAFYKRQYTLKCGVNDTKRDN